MSSQQEDIQLQHELIKSGQICTDFQVQERTIWIDKHIINSSAWKTHDPFTKNSNYFSPIKTVKGSYIYVRKNWKSPYHVKPPRQLQHNSRAHLPRMSLIGLRSYDSDSDSDSDSSDDCEISKTIEQFRNLYTEELNDGHFLRYLELRYGQKSQEICSYDMRIFLDTIQEKEEKKEKVKVKVVFGDDIRVLQSDKLNRNELNTFIWQSFGMEIFTLKYKDVDNDLIIIDTKKDLRRAYDCASVAKRCLKVFVFNIPNTRISIIRSNHTEEEVDPKSVIQSQVNTQNELEHAQQYDTKAIEDNQAQGIFDSYECNSDKTMTYNYKGCLTIVLCVLCVVIGLSCMIQPEDKTNWRGITREEETEMNDKMQQIDVLEGRAYHTKTKETLHPLKVSREDKEHQNSNKRTVEGEQIPLPTKSVEDDSSTSDSGDDNDTSVDATEDFIDNIDSQDDVVCADVDSFEATDQESPGSIKATHSHDEDNDNDNESQVEYDNTNENATQNNDESQDTNSQESTGDGVTSDMTASEEKEMKPAVQFKLKDRMAQSEGRWDVWSYNTWTGSLLLYHPFNPMPYCMMSCQALNRSLECGTQTTHKNCRLNRVENQERSGIGWIMNGTDWELKNKTIRERLLGNKDE
eukprot:350454_1